MGWLSKAWNTVHNFMSKANPVLTAITGIADTVGGFINSKNQRKAAEYNSDLQYKSAQEEREFVKRQQEYQNEWNLQQWHRENEYNTPAAQMQRYREAGLNPALMYSQGTNGNSNGSPEAAAVMPSPGAFRQGADKVPYHIPELGQFLHMAINVKQRLAEIDRINTESDLMRSNIVKNNYFNENMLDSWQQGLRYGSNLKAQKYWLNGGGVTERESALFRKYDLETIESLLGLRKSQKNLQAELLNKYKAEAAESHSRKSYWDNRDHWYRTTQRDWNEFLGGWRSHVDYHLDKTIGDVIGIFTGPVGLISKLAQKALKLDLSKFK